MLPSAMNCGLDTITNALKNRDQVTVAGFGTFKVIIGSHSEPALTDANPLIG
jgi:nucleoid DNA-binding protein